MYTLDSNILISYLNGDSGVARQLLVWRGESTGFFISVVSEIEIFSLPGLTSTETGVLDRFLREFTVVPLESTLGRLAADIRRNHHLKLGDAIIVATAKMTGSALVTRDKEIISKAGKVVKLVPL